MKRLLLATVISVAAVGATAATFQAPDLKFIHYTTADGLSSNCVRAIVQDEEGFVWFGSDGGLVRFDGTSSKVFTPTDGSGNDYLYVLSICRYGRGLLVGTDRGVYTYNPVTETFVPMELTYSPGVTGTITGNIHDIEIDRKGNVWVSAERKGIFRINSSGTVTDNFVFEEADNFLGDIYVDPSDIVWALSNIAGAGVYRFDASKQEFRAFAISDAENLLSRGALAITVDSHGDYWLGTWENGLVRFNPRTGEAQRLTKPDDTWNVWHIHSVTEYGPTTLLVGSDSGLTLVNTITGECKVYKSDELDHQSLSDRFVYPVTIDADGGLWVGTFYRGVNYVSARSERFRRWRHSRFGNSISGNIVSCLCEDPKGYIWAGTADGGLCRYDPEKDSYQAYPLTSSNEPENVNALCPDDKRLWVGTYSRGAGWLDPFTGRWTPVSMEGAGMNYSCYAIYKDSRGRIWMGATETLTLYNPEKNLFEPVIRLNAWINGMVEDNDEKLWISTPGAGVCKYDLRTGDIKVYLASDKPGSLPVNHINSISRDEKGNISVATTHGVFLFNKRAGGFQQLCENMPRLTAQSTARIGDDMWVATTSGLLNVRPDGNSRLYGENDGLSDNQFMSGASLVASDGKIYFGTVNGLSRVDPLLLGGSAAPTLKFTGLDIVNNPISVGDPHLPASLNNIDELVLTHADHTFSIYFSALSYTNPGGNTYRYRLEGFDKTWHETGKENRATYSNLSPGTYTLHVKGANSDGVWNDEGIRLKIVVRPAWYMSTLMKLLYVMIGLALLLFVVKLVLKRIERNHIVELDRISSNKEKEMFRSKLNFFTIVAHEIRTPVSLIIGPLEKILESSEKFTTPVKEDLKIIDRNARRLLSLVNQLLDFKKVEDNALPMGFRHERVVPLVEGVADRFRPSLEHKGVTLKVDCPNPDLIADIDPEAITKLVSNLINNARKFTKDRIEVVCKAMPDGEHFMISVTDNGIGIEKENRDKIFKPFFQVLDNINESKGGTGLGLSIVKSVADAHGGTIELDSTPGKGSCFMAILPLRQSSVIPSDNGTENLEEAAAKPMTAVDSSVDDRPVLLIVDDNEEMVSFISSHFDQNYKVVTAANGREALDRMGRNQVSMIICDWMMPVMDGVEFLKAIRENENYSHIPFVMLTAKTDNTSKIETMRHGADAYVEKPFSISYLEARIDNLLEMRKRLREKYSHSPLEPITTLAPTQVDNELLTRLQELIEEHLANPELNVDFLAEQLGISRSGLYAKIKSLADVTPHELIQITRLKKAAEYLAQGKYRVQEVSYMVGINNTSYFSRLFQKQFGVRPTEFHK